MSEPREFRVLVTGSRWVTDGDAMLVRAKLLMVCGGVIASGRPVVIVEGRCPRGGVDLVAQRWAEETPGVIDEGHPASWSEFGKSAGMLRNAAMVRLGADVCLAFPAPYSAGTWDCLKRAARAGIPGRVYPVVGRHSGKVETVEIPGLTAEPDHDDVAVGVDPETGESVLRGDDR